MSHHTQELKMWLAVRADIVMPLGKLATQAGHGYATCLLLAYQGDKELVDAYQADAMPKITVQVPNAIALQRVADEAKDAGIFTAHIVDAGRTVFAEPTATVCAFGPAYRSQLPPYLKRLCLYDVTTGATDDR